MIEWFTWVQVVVACVAGIVCLVAGFSGRLPNDITVGATALVLVLLLVQLVVAIVAPVSSRHIRVRTATPLSVVGRPATPTQRSRWIG